jgi:hypothetical protein
MVHKTLNFYVMENFALTLQSGTALSEYIISNRLMLEEKKVLEELTLVIENGDQEKLDWFAQFGVGFYPICRNVREYRRHWNSGLPKSC